MGKGGIILQLQFWKVLVGEPHLPKLPPTPTATALTTQVLNLKGPVVLLDTEIDDKLNF